MPRDAVNPAAKGAITLAVALAIGATLIDSGPLGWLAGTAVFVLVMYCVLTVPLRYSLLGITLCALMLENPTDRPADGAYQSPLYMLGALMLAHMNQTTGQSWMILSGTEFLVFILVGVNLYRRSTNSPIDRAGRVDAPEPLRKLAILSLVGTLYVFLWGMLRGGEFSKSLWQVDKVIYIPIVFLLWDSALRGPGDFRMIGQAILTAAVYKAAMAYYVMHLADLGGREPAYATSHHDSLLFAGAVVMLLSLIIHRAGGSVKRVALLAAPVLLMGMLANNRRMVWVQIGLVFFVVYLAMPMNAVKRKIKRFLTYMAPFAVVYVIVGWNFSGGIFKPIDTIKSVTQPATDISTMTRDIENYDIAMTIKQHPLMGSGYGHGYIELIPLPPMPHPLERWLPHNSLLGLWFQAGFIGYTMMTLLWTAGIYFGVRAYRHATDKMHRAVSLLCFGSVLMYMIQCYGDVGLGSWIAVYTVGPGLAIAGKLAVITGAWPAKGKKAAAAAAAASGKS